MCYRSLSIICSANFANLAESKIQSEFAFWRLSRMVAKINFCNKNFIIKEEIKTRPDFDHQKQGCIFYFQLKFLYANKYIKGDH